MRKTTILIMAVIAVPLVSYSQQTDIQATAHNGKVIAAGAHIRVLAPGFAYKMGVGGKLLPILGKVEAVRTDTILFISEHHGSLLAIPLGSIEKLEVREYTTKSNKKINLRRGLIGAGIGGPAGAIACIASDASPPGVYVLASTAGLVNGFFIGTSPKPAVYGLLIGAAAGGLTGILFENSDNEYYWMAVAISAGVGAQALAGAQQGTQSVQDTIEGMNRIREQVQETAKRIKRLGESSQEISEIVQLIDDIADRTSILALNASIQAAMAGEAGRGFAVVAEEVERLAERSTEATKQISGLVRTIQNETNEAVSAMEATTREVVEGSLLADQAGHALGEIEGISNRMAELIQSISLAAKQQARGS